MRVLFEITHPKHAHLFKNLIIETRRKGHTVAITSRDKDVTLKLLDAWKFDIGPHTCLSSQPRNGLAGLAWELMVRDARLFSFCRTFKPDIIFARVGPSASHVGFALGIPVYVFEDTDDARLQQWISFPLATHVCTARHYKKSWGRKHLRYNSFDEMAYLHPNRFTPNVSKVKQAGLTPGNYIVVRFVAWKATHDLTEKGVAANRLAETVQALQMLAPVVISSEGDLPAELESLRLNTDPQDFHHILAHAIMSFGESSTVATEGAMLGVPGILVNTMTWSSIDRLKDEFGLIYQTADVSDGLAKVRDWFNLMQSEDLFSEKKHVLQTQCVDLTHWMLDLMD